MISSIKQALGRVDKALLQRLNASGRILLTQTKLNGRYVIRMVAGQADSTWEDWKKGWELVVEMAKS